MTYSLTEQEEILLENKLNNLLAEKETVYTYDPKSSKTETDIGVFQTPSQKRIGYWMDRYADDEIEYLPALPEPNYALAGQEVEPSEVEVKPEDKVAKLAALRVAATLTPAALAASKKISNAAAASPRKVRVPPEIKINKITQKLDPLRVTPRQPPRSKVPAPPKFKYVAPILPDPEAPRPQVEPVKKPRPPKTKRKPWFNAEMPPKPVPSERPKLKTKPKPVLPPLDSFPKRPPATRPPSIEANIAEIRERARLALERKNRLYTEKLEANFKEKIKKFQVKIDAEIKLFKRNNLGPLEHNRIIAKLEMDAAIAEQQFLENLRKKNLKIVNPVPKVTLPFPDRFAPTEIPPELRTPVPTTSKPPPLVMPEIPPPKLEVPKSTLPKIKVNLGSTKIKLRHAEALSANVLAAITAIQQDTAGKRPKIELAKVQDLNKQWKFAEADRVALAQQVKNFEQQLRATATEDISRQTIIDLEKSIEIKAADQEKILKGAAERLGFDANATDLTPEEKAALNDTTTQKTSLEKYANNAIDNHRAFQNAQRAGSVSFNYKIAKGDTLGELAKRYNTTVEALVAANKSAVISTDPQHLKYGWITAGEKLVIPIESKVALLQPGKVWTPSQVKNMLTREQLANVSPGDKVWVNEAGDLVASPEVGDPNAKFVDARRTSAEVGAAAKRKKSTIITKPGDLPRKFTKKYGWHKDAYIVQITDKNGNPRFMLQVDGQPWTRQKGGRPLFISAGQQAELYNIFTKMNKPPGIISKTLGVLAKPITVPGRLLLTGTTRLMNMSGRAAMSAVGLGSIKGDIISTIAMITAMEYGTGRLLRNSAKEQSQMRVADINVIAAKMVKHSDGKITLEQARKSVEELNLSENPLWQLSPAQLRGGAGNLAYYMHHYDTMLSGAGQSEFWKNQTIFPLVDEMAEMLSMDDSITRTMKTTTANGSNVKDMATSFANMTYNDINDMQYSDEFVRDNIVSVMLPDGKVYRINDWGLGDPGEDGKNDSANQPGWLHSSITSIHAKSLQFKNGQDAWNAVMNTGTVVQIIPLYEEVEDEKGTMSKKRLPIREQTQRMSTSYLQNEKNDNKWREGQFKDVYHHVSDKEEPGGRIWIQQGPPGQGKYMYIPSKDEIEPFLLHHIEHLIPEDWYLDWKPKVSPLPTIKGSYKRDLEALGNDPEKWMEYYFKNNYYTARTSNEAFKYIGPMTAREQIDWWKKHRVENGRCEIGGAIVFPDYDSSTKVGCEAQKGKMLGIKPPDPKIKTGEYADSAVDWVRQQLHDLTNGWVGGLPGSATDRHANLPYVKGGDEGEGVRDKLEKEISGLTDEELDKIYMTPRGTISTKVEQKSLDDEKKLIADLKANDPSNKTQPSAIGGGDIIANKGWPTTKIELLALFKDLGKQYKLDPKLLQTLSARESTMRIEKGEVIKGEYMGDLPLGIRGAWGLFHVRKETGDRAAAIDDYNQRYDTEITWQMAATDPHLVAHIGADHFARLFHEHMEQGQSTEKAIFNSYAIYNGGRDWTRLEDWREKDCKKNGRAKPEQCRVEWKANTFLKYYDKLLRQKDDKPLIDKNDDPGFILQVDGKPFENKIYSKNSAILEGIALAA